MDRLKKCASSVEIRAVLCVHLFFFALINNMKSA